MATNNSDTGCAYINRIRTISIMKKEYYITELHMGDDGLEDTTDHSGPHTLSRARRIIERMFKYPGNMINPYSFNIRGPNHQVRSVCDSHSYDTPWYASSPDQSQPAK